MQAQEMQMQFFIYFYITVNHAGTFIPAFLLPEADCIKKYK